MPYPVPNAWDSSDGKRRRPPLAWVWVILFVLLMLALFFAEQIEEWLGLRVP